MPKVKVYNLEGKELKEENLSESVFGLPANDALLHQIFVALSANKRTVIAHTKDRAERAGSGKKPWKQKGTGNARVGQVRNPLWRKGGVVFGPTKDRNFKKDINKKMKLKAFLVALSEKVKKQSLVLVDSLQIKPLKTKEFAKALANLKLSKSVLIGFSENEKDLYRYSRNLSGATSVQTKNLSVYDILNHKSLLLSQESIDYLTQKYSKK